MKSNYQGQLIAKLAAEIVQMAEDAEAGKAAWPSAADWVRSALALSRIELTSVQFEKASDHIFKWSNAYSPSDHDLADRIITMIWQMLDHRARMRAQFEQYAVEATSVADFIGRFYKTDRYTGQNKTTGWDDDYAAGLLAMYETAFTKDGYVSIGEHDSITGRIVSLMRLTPAPGAP